MLKFGYQGAGDLFGMAQCGVDAEKAGFDMIWIGDHFTFWFLETKYPETLTTLALTGTKTSKIRIGPGVTDPFRRHPAVIAQSIATLDVLSGGRMNLGVGAGEEMNLAPFGVAFEKPITKVREAVTVIKRLWEATPSSPASFEGQFYNLRDAFIQIKPVQSPHPPIYISATGPVARRMVGEMADGWYAHLHSPQTFQEDLEEVRMGAKSTGRQFEDIDRLAFLFVSVSKDYDLAMKAIQMPASFPLILAKEKMIRLGFEPQTPKWMTMEHLVINPNTVKELCEAAKKVPLGALEATMAFGKPDDCIKKFEAFAHAGATGVVLFNSSPDRQESFELFSKQIIPYFKEQAER